MFLISDVELPWRAVIPIEFGRLHFGARDVPEAASFTPDSSFLFIMTSENLHVYRILLPDVLNFSRPFFSYLLGDSYDIFLS